MLYSEVGSCKAVQEIVILGGRVTLVEEKGESSRGEKGRRQLAGCIKIDGVVGFVRGKSRQ